MPLSPDSLLAVNEALAFRELFRSSICSQLHRSMLACVRRVNLTRPRDCHYPLLLNFGNVRVARAIVASDDLELGDADMA
jgi:hypothetical protein